MRSTGFIDDVRRLAPGDHVCWPFADRAGFVTLAQDFVADGLRRVEQVVYFDWRGVDAARRDVGRADIDALLVDGSLRLEAGDPVFATGAALESDAIAEALGEMVHAAMRAGFSGVRMVSDATPVVQNEAQRVSFLRLHHLLDEQIADGLPLTAMCAIDITSADPAFLCDMVCLHPLAASEHTLFHLHAAAGGGLALAGDLDAHSAALLGHALERLDQAGILFGGRVAVDAHELAFIDHRSLLALQRWAERHARTVGLDHAPGSAVRIAELLPLSHLSVLGRSAG